MSATAGGDATEVLLPRPVLDAIQAHALETFPEECCGFLLGQEAGPVRRVTEGLRARNVHPEMRESRYTIDPREVLEVDRRFRGTATGILGFYHSHPGYPAEPSAFDRERAWPWYVYLILAVPREGPCEATAWSLDPARETLRPVLLRLL